MCTRLVHFDNCQTTDQLDPKYHNRYILIFKDTKEDQKQASGLGTRLLVLDMMTKLKSPSSQEDLEMRVDVCACAGDSLGTFPFCSRGAWE